MSEIKCYLQNVECHPQNLAELEVELSFENDSPSASVKTTSFEFWGDDAERLNTYLAQGLNGGNGIFEGVPFRIEKCDQVLLDGYVDLTDSGTEFECDLIKSVVKESGKIDFLRDVADGFSFAYLSDADYAGKKGYISSNDFIEIPYVVSAIPNYTEALIMGVSVFVIAKETYEIALNLANILAAILGGATGTLEAIAMAVAYTAYLTVMVIALFKMIKSLIDNIIQSRKNKLGMRVDLHFKRACEYLNLSFSSTILDDSTWKYLTIIPQKITSINNKDKNEKKSESKYKGHFDGTFADFIKAMEDYFNAKVRIIDNTLHFERVDYWNEIASYQLPNINLSRSTYKLNASELKSNLFIKYQLDSTDLNTYDDYTGTSVQVTTQPIVVTDERKRLLKTLNYINIPFALAKRKETLTDIEKALKGISDAYETVYEAILGFFDKMASIFGGSVDHDVLPLFPDRKGWMKLSGDFIGVQKIALILDNGYISENNQTNTSANKLFESFHSVSLPLNNQFYLYKDKEIPLCCEDYDKIKNNNVIKTFSGEFAYVDSLVWNPHKETAKISFRIKKDYTKNLKQTITIDGN